ncbi:Reverse transcriptase RNA-dependent DNA polymerase [Arabidopsis suecica]|uniref:Reverse transcriptase RNA-dependent DNA polymerase n=1 Tax=Arabidopsis suecica TaxID=45249 RepID=A0A8T1ZXG8_ARASU|nr:Reverse transcriptase RNA-dependent DNA polymerase [Arabidopsis suecica]
MTWTDASGSYRRCVGSDPNSEDKREDEFLAKLADAETPLYLNCLNHSKLSAIVSHFRLKTKNGWSDKSFDELLETLPKMLPKDNVIHTYLYDVKKFLKSFDMGYEKIHACVNDYCLLERSTRSWKIVPNAMLQGGRLICALALYRLKQAPRAWYGKVAQFLQFCGYEAPNSDLSLFFKKKGGVHVVVLLYVDDMIITGNDDGEITRLQEDMSIRFEMKKLVELNIFLGLEVEKVKNGIFVDQQGYARSIVEMFRVHDGKTRTTLMDVNIKLKRDEGSLLPDPQPYHAFVGSLLYLTITRPDIAFIVGLVSRLMQAPRKATLRNADFGGDLWDDWERLSGL